MAEHTDLPPPHSFYRPVQITVSHLLLPFTEGLAICLLFANKTATYPHQTIYSLTFIYPISSFRVPHHTSPSSALTALQPTVHCTQDTHRLVHFMSMQQLSRTSSQSFTSSLITNIRAE
jgi:hypothetical protein